MHFYVSGRVKQKMDYKNGITQQNYKNVNAFTLSYFLGCVSKPSKRYSGSIQRGMALNGHWNVTSAHQVLPEQK